MYVTHRKDVEAFADTCGTIEEVYNSKELSLAIAVINGKAKPHMHKVLEEVYYVVKGNGRMTIGDETFDVGPGDTVTIPKNVYHFMESIDGPVEVIVVTHPKYDTSDVIEK